MMANIFVKYNTHSDDIRAGEDNIYCGSDGKYICQVYILMMPELARIIYIAGQIANIFVKYNTYSLKPGPSSDTLMCLQIFTYHKNT